ncbi:MAG: pyridoxal phosphate-dependent aminotransferase [Patescibacteria group bacterium]
MLQTSKRARQTIASPIRKFLPLAEAAEKKGLKIFKLNIGQPDILPPVSVWQEILKLQKKDRLIPYAPSLGYLTARQAWQKFYADWGIRVKTEDIMITTGGSEAIIFSLLAVADPGDEIIIFEPGYSSYKSFAKMTGVKLVPITLKLDNNFSLPSAAELRKKITRRTKAIVIINPNNPTGRIYSKKELSVLVKVAKKRGLFIIADETYRELTFIGQRAPSLLDFPAVRQQVIVTDSVSKKFSACGSRVGCLISSNKELMANILKFAQARLSSPTLEQLAFVPVLKNSKQYIKKLNLEYRRRRDVVYGELEKIPGLTLFQPEATFYLIVGLPVRNSEDLVKWLLTKFNYQGKTVMVTPAEDFYSTPGKGQNEIRIAYVLNTKELKEAMMVFARGLEQYLKVSG